MNKLYTYFFLGLVALPLAGITGGVVSSEKAYATTKSGLMGLTRTLAIELGKYSINVNCVCPDEYWLCW